jgi:hypothetical protein
VEGDTEENAGDVPAAEAEDAAVEAALRELFAGPEAGAAVEPQLALTSWWYRMPGLL